jgi:mono/diheme cytochrome c family protein
MAWLLALLLLLTPQNVRPAASQVAAPKKPDAASPVKADAAADAAAHAATIQKYCLTCHNDRLKTGGLTLAAADLTKPSDTAETWEKVIRKLRTGAMPPPGVPRPDPATAASLATYLETSIDREAMRTPNPGRLPLLHRLSRTEYQNAIRDLLAIDALPAEIDYAVLLPADNSSSGFDNLADLLFVSPAVMERYLDAAEKISRLAVGDTSAPVLVNRYRLHPEQWQGARVDDLSWGTRGGVAVKNDFPADGEYRIAVQLAAPPSQPHQLEISVDGERIQLVTVGANAAGRRDRGARPQPRTGEAEPDAALEFRVPIKAGPRLVGVTFIERDEVRDETTLKPRMRSRGTEPALTLVTISGPYGAKSPGNSSSRRRIFTCHPSTAGQEEACAKQILLTLTRRAYRRPTGDTDVQDLWPFYEQGRADGGFDRGIERALERLLVSPQFLYRIEHNPLDLAQGKPVDSPRGIAFKVSDLELASRLSFFLWSSIPDDQLLNVAAQGQLSRPEVLEREVRRMLRDRRSESLVTNFAEQWLFVRDIEAKQPDGLLFPDFDETLRESMRTETVLFIDSVLRGNRSVLDLLTANYSYLNERLARHYGIPHVEGSYFRRVTFPPDNPRGGLLGQGSILTLTSYATRTSPVVRGKWVLENLLAAAPPPPPADVPALKTEGSEPGRTLTMREAMAAHRANPSCATCHVRMDPIGFAMENFDAVGRWRDHDGGNDIDASGVLPGGATFNGVAGLKQVLLASREQFVNTVASKLLMYALGRNLQYYDEPAVRAIVRQSAAANYTLPSLVIGVVTSAPFQLRARN